MPMSTDLTHAISAAVKRLLYPLVRILLRQGIPFGAFSDLAKQVYVDVADREFGIDGRKQTISRVAIITGLTRKEVSRVQGLPVANDAAIISRYNRAARVVAGWRRDTAFSDANGKPLDLALEAHDAKAPSGTPGFSELVQRFSGDVPVRAVLDELKRIGTIEVTDDQRVRLLTRAYVPNGSEVEKIGILGTDVADLLYSITHNIQHPDAPPYFQRKVSYDNLPATALEELKPLVDKHAQALLEDFDRFLADRDRDVNPAASGCGRHRAGVGIYYFETASPGDDSDKDMP